MDIRQNLGAERSVSLPLPSRLANASVKVARDRLQMTEQLRFLGRILAISLSWQAATPPSGRFNRPPQSLEEGDARRLAADVATRVLHAVPPPYRQSPSSNAHSGLVDRRSDTLVPRSDDLGSSQTALTGRTCSGWTSLRGFTVSSQILLSRAFPSATRPTFHAPGRSDLGGVTRGEPHSSARAIATSFFPSGLLIHGNFSAVT
jgi:hypothetical protein